MILWGVSRLVRMGAELCGADNSAANGAAMIVCTLFTPLDPIGGLAGLAHASANAAANDGSKGAKVVDNVLSITAISLGMVDIPNIDTGTDSNSA